MMRLQLTILPSSVTVFFQTHNFQGHKIFRPEISLVRKNVRTKIFQDPNFSDPHFFSDQNYFSDQHFFSDPKLFLKNFLLPKFIKPQVLFAIDSKYGSPWHSHSSLSKRCISFCWTKYVNPNNVVQRAYRRTKTLVTCSKKDPH